MHSTCLFPSIIRDTVLSHREEGEAKMEFVIPLICTESFDKMPLPAEQNYECVYVKGNASVTIFFWEIEFCYRAVSLWQWQYGSEHKRSPSVYTQCAVYGDAFSPLILVLPTRTPVRVLQNIHCYHVARAHYYYPNQTNVGLFSFEITWIWFLSFDSMEWEKVDRIWCHTIVSASGIMIWFDFGMLSTHPKSRHTDEWFNRLCAWKNI